MYRHRRSSIILYGITNVGGELWNHEMKNVQAKSGCSHVRDSIRQGILAPHHIGMHTAKQLKV